MPERAPVQTVTVGDARVTYLPDGTGRFLATASFPGSSSADWQNAFRDMVDGEQRMVTSIGAFLIQIGDRNIIMDTGTGPIEVEFPGFGPLVGGDFLNSLAQAGLDRHAVTDVIFTHLHIDHVGWVTLDVDGQRELTFPRARHMVTQTEWAFWYGGDNPAGPHPQFVQQPLAPIIEFVAPGDEIAPGLTLLDSAGHTPGHISLLYTHGDQRLCLTADIWHNAAQVQQQDWVMAFDIDGAAAIAARKRIVRELLIPNTLVASNHFSNTVFGHVQQAADGRYSWLPLDA